MTYQLRESDKRSLQGTTFPADNGIPLYISNRDIHNLRNETSIKNLWTLILPPDMEKIKILGTK